MTKAEEARFWLDELIELWEGGGGFYVQTHEGRKPRARVEADLVKRCRVAFFAARVERDNPPAIPADGGQNSEAPNDPGPDS